MSQQRYKLILALEAIIATALILVAVHTYGAGLSPDSVGYIATARNLVKGHGMVGVDDSPLIVQPPLYPFVLAAIQRITGIDPAVSAGGVSAILFGLTVFLAGSLFRKYVSSSLVALVATAAIIVFSPLSNIFIMAWTEPLFTVLALAFFVVLLAYFEKPQFKLLGALSLICALACLTRYIGLTLVITGGLTLLGFQLRRHESLKNTLLSLVFFTALSVIPLGIWIARNIAITGTPIGPRAPSIFTLKQNLSFTYSTILPWYVPGTRGVIIVPVLFVILLIAVKNWKHTRQQALLLVPVALFCMIYASFIIIASTTTAYDQIDDRLLAPVAIPITLLLVAIVNWALEPFNSPARRWSITLLIVLGLTLWGADQARQTIPLLRSVSQSGLGYSDKAWREGPFASYLITHPLPANCTIYTNDPDAVYYLLGSTSKYAPMVSYYNSSERAADLTSLQGAWPPEHSACLIWFNDDVYSEGVTYYSVEQLQTIATMNKVDVLDSGSVYTVSIR